MATRTRVDQASRATAFEHRKRFLSHIQSSDREENLFKGLYLHESEDASVAGLRRRRRRVANVPDTITKTVSLVNEDGTLYWRDNVPAPRRGRARRARARRGRRRDLITLGLSEAGTTVFTKSFPTLAPNKVVAALAAIDARLNDAIDANTLRSRLRDVQRAPNGEWKFSAADVVGPFSGRTLLFVHGTFSNAKNMLAEMTANSPRGLELMGRAVQGPKAYDRILFFEHPTLSVSPWVNALELGRAMAGSTGQIDVVAHSRGGLVVRWWLEAFGDSLLVGNTQPRAVLAGSPLHGTSLAAPDKLQGALSMISNIGTLAEKTLGLVGMANPFLWVGGKLVEVVVSVTGTLAKTPVIDALTTIVPGLAGQSAVENNHELNRLRLGPPAIEPAYYAVTSNFETDDPGWRFWRNFRGDRAADLVTDLVFPDENDLVVDTWSMIDIGVPKLKVLARCDFGTSRTVWHCNYFRQAKTIDFIASAFEVPLP